MEVTDYIIQYLQEKGVEYIFGFPGGSVVCLLDAIARNPYVEYIGTQHEQAAAYAAEGYARVKNSCGVALASNGPGAVNLIGGVASAYCDSIPVLYLTGQANTFDLKGDKNVRQLAFQEIDIISIAKPITKYCEMINDPLQIKYYLDKAFFEMNSGRKGPALIDLPIDVQRAEIDPESLLGYSAESDKERVPENIDVHKTIDLLLKAKRPIILAGGGIRLAKAEDLLNSVLRQLQIPVVHSLMGKDSIVGDYEYNCGLIGIYGTRYGNLALANSDLIIAIGSRLDQRQTGKLVSEFARKAKLIRVDIDKNELQNKIKADEIHYETDVGVYLNQILKYNSETLDIAEWRTDILKYKNLFKTEAIIPTPNPNQIVMEITRKFRKDATIISDVGQNQMWVAQSGGDDNSRRYLFAGGFGSMGCSLPMAIGAYFADKEKQIVSFNGDGGFQMNIQELQTIKRYNIPIKIFILNNRCLGMIRIIQEAYFDERYIGTKIGFDDPDFISVAGAYGIDGCVIIDAEELHKAEDFLFDNKPYICDVILDEDTDVIPKPSVGRPLEDSEPLIARSLLKEIMKE